MENSINFEQDAAAPVQIEKGALNLISNLIAEQVSLTRTFEELTTQVEKYSAAIKRIQTEQLPEAMRAAGVFEFTTTDFYQVKLEDVYFANIKAENQDAAFEWLDENNHSDIIKNDVSLSFGKGEDEDAQTVMEFLKDGGYDPINKKHIHWQTLRAFVKEQMTKGISLPEAIDVHVVPTAKIKRK